MISNSARYRLGIAAPAALVTACLAALLLAKPTGEYGGKNETAADNEARMAIPPPAIEPVAFKPLAAKDAQAINAEIPFSAAPNPPASPFQFAGDAAALARATDCLTAAVLYEAGNDATGQRAVAQVVINRARHPAFPKSICGVVFQGSERRTGCQFTFTCDGALARRYSGAAWGAARQIASSALMGNVYAPVGLATHYHTDWVVPYWSDSLEKITSVGTHLFFRWPGGWGRPAAYRRTISGYEPLVAKLAPISLFHRSADMTLPGEAAENIADNGPGNGALPNGIIMDENNRYTGTFTPAKKEVNAGKSTRMLLSASGNAEEYLALANAKCAGKSYCKIMGWLDGGSVPEVGEIGEAGRNSMVFSYLRDEKNGFEKALWNCTIYPRKDKRQCMKR
ncbi:cell wall hydrolase [Sphingorhabdus arenilitoris]|uniref:Cell wall hydrolase n=1 Tax=Sphingorhabdus arenilitoris TaxID=1490041 RepID=A0ABV8RHL3_9SPHN